MHLTALHISVVSGYCKECHSLPPEVTESVS